MHYSIDSYLEYLRTRGRSPLTAKAVLGDLCNFVRWWEAARQCAFAPEELAEDDVYAWLSNRQAARVAVTTLNRALISLRGYVGWAQQLGLIAANPLAMVTLLPHPTTMPRSIPPAAVDALLAAVHAERQLRLQLRDAVLLALLIHTGLRAQELCDLQLGDVDLVALAVTVRRGKGKRPRRVPLNSEATAALRHYLGQLRCPEGVPPLGSASADAPLLVGFDYTCKGRPMTLGVNQRLVQRVVALRARQAASMLRAAALRCASAEEAQRMLGWAQALDTTTPHTLRHSLARRMLDAGANLRAVQQTLGHCNRAITGMYVSVSGVSAHSTIA